MNNLGKQTAAGFLPMVPNAEDAMSMIAKSVGGWNEGNNTPAGKALVDNGSDPKGDMLRNYVQVFSSPAGQKVLDDILSMSLHRSPYMNGEGHTLEQQTAYGLERKGQNGLAIAILSKIVAGRELPAPSAKKKPRKK